jgi:hypothetical protein
MSQAELIFHVIDLAVLIFGVATPIVWAVLRLRSILLDFPPHRHLAGGIILYPKGYAPGRESREAKTTGVVNGDY